MTREIRRKAAKPAKGARQVAARTKRGATSRRGGGEPPSLLRQLTSIEQDGGDGILVFGEGETLAVTSLDKEFFPRDGYTKGDLMRYYVRVAPVLLPAIDGRPLTLKRYPNGIDGPSFYQHNAGENLPEVVRVEQVMTEEGMQARFVGGDLATLLYTVQLGTIAVDAWHSRVGSLDAPDYAILDLDPGDDVPFRRVIEVAALVKGELDRPGLRGVAKTSGSTGLHVLVPLPRRATYETAAEIAEEVASRVAAARPEIATVERAIDRRPPGTVYVDHLQNARGKTLAAVLSARARPGATVSTPVGWPQMTRALDPQKLAIATVPRRLARLRDTWEGGMAEGNPAAAVRAVVRTKRTV
jgi:bifunctional non-homologous end joining protein LigD